MDFIEVCAGAGGLSLGLIQAGFIPKLLVDNNPDCVKTLIENHPNVNVLLENIEDFDTGEYCDLLVGGIPCQSFSQVGQRKGLDDTRGCIIYEFIRLINKIKPKMYLIENVKGLLTLDNGKIFDQILELLIETGYEINYNVLNAVDYGVAQKRERLFIVGFKIQQNINFQKKLASEKF